MEVDFRKPVKNTCLVEGEYLCTQQYSAAGKDYKIERRETGEETETQIKKRESDIGDDIVRSEENVDD